MSKHSEKHLNIAESQIKSFLSFSLVPFHPGLKTEGSIHKKINYEEVSPQNTLFILHKMNTFCIALLPHRKKISQQNMSHSLHAMFKSIKKLMSRMM